MNNSVSLSGLAFYQFNNGQKVLTITNGRITQEPMLDDVITNTQILGLLIDAESVSISTFTMKVTGKINVA